MTDLNMSLWGFGAVIILSVIFYNFWQEYKAKRNVERAFGESQDDVLMQSGEQSTPTARSKNESEEASTLNTYSFNANSADERQEPSLENEISEDQDSVSPESEPVITERDSVAKAPVEISTLSVDDFIDYVIQIEFDTPTRGDKIVHETQSFRRVGNKPVHFVGINSEGKREEISHTAMYSQILAGVQLVTRSGALNELEYSEAVMKLRQISDNLGAHPDIPDMKHVMDLAQDLYLFVCEYDAQLSVNVVAKDAPWEIPTLVGALRKQGFDGRPEGRMVMSDGESGNLYSLSINAGATDQVTSQITLLLDVPAVAPFRGAYNAMVSCAKSLALRLGGAIVDDGGDVLTDEVLDQIREQVELFYTAMQAAEIPAGSTRAIRLFS